MRNIRAPMPPDLRTIIPSHLLHSNSLPCVCRCSHLLFSFFPSNALWLSPGCSSCQSASCTSWTEVGPVHCPWAVTMANRKNTNKQTKQTNNQNQKQHQTKNKHEPQNKKRQGDQLFFLTGGLCLSAGRGTLKLTRLPRHDRGPVPGGNRSAASCLCSVLRRAFIPLPRRDRLKKKKKKKKGRVISWSIQQRRLEEWR